jgi:hypothetical protein
MPLTARLPAASAMSRRLTLAYPLARKSFHVGALQA